MIVGLPKTSQTEMKRISEPLVTDLTMLYKAIQDRAMELIAQSEVEGWTPQELIQKLEELI